MADGETAIDALISDRQAEELFLDFKRSADSGSGTNLHDRDRANLAKAISGFGNSEGGVVVWGVDCSRHPDHGDVARDKVKIKQPKRFVSWLEAVVSGCTLPPHPHVRHHAIEAANASEGFVVTYVPRSYLAPHQCVKPPHYYIRAGSDFVPAPHGVLAGLFGRAPQPFVFHMWTIAPAKAVVLVNRRQAEFQLGFQLGSFGPGIARDLYINIKMFPPKGLTKIGISVQDQQNWTGRQMFEVVTNLVSVDGFKLAPSSQVQPINFTVVAAPPFESGLHYEITFGHGGSPLRKLEARRSPEELQRAFDEFMRKPKNPDYGRKFVEEFMAVDMGQIYGQEMIGMFDCS